MDLLLAKKKSVALLVSAIYTATNVVFAMTPEKNYWTERRRARQESRQTQSMALARSSTLPVYNTSIPAASSVDPLGSSKGPAARSKRIPRVLTADQRRLLMALPGARMSLRRVALPAGVSRGLVIHLQDVHKNTEAQRNIAETLSAILSAASLAPTVALEGAFAPIDLSYPRGFPDAEAAKIAAEEMLHQNEISGPIYSLLTHPGPIPAVMGIDDRTHYDANVEAFRRVFPKLGEEKNRLAGIRRTLEGGKESTFHSALLDFDRTVEAYRSGAVRLGVYVRALGASPYERYPDLNRFQKTLDLEESLDFQRVESERKQVLERLVRIFDRGQTERLMGQSVAYRSGEIGTADFYTELKSLCAEAGVDLGKYPAMAGYIRYVLLADQIDADRLFDDVKGREREVYTGLIRSESERRLWRESEQLALEEKLVDFSLTPSDWKEYIQTHRSVPAIPSERHPGATPAGIRESDLSSFEEFYIQADARDEAMANNLLTHLAVQPTAVLVTGGYHAPGITRQLADAGYAVASVVPKLEKVESAQGAAYLSVFAREKTPLDKLFEGSKLFLADAPVSDQSLTAFSLSAAAIALIRSRAQQLATPLREYLSIKYQGVQGRVKQNIATLRVKFKGSTLITTYDASQPTGQRSRQTVGARRWFMDWSLRKILENVFGFFGKAISVAQKPIRLSFDLAKIPQSDLLGRTVLVRTNLDDTAESADDSRLNIAASTVRYLSARGARVVLLTHRGRPTGFEENLTVGSRVDVLAKLVGMGNIPVFPGELLADGTYRCLSETTKKAIRKMQNGDVVALENLRFDERETSQSEQERNDLAGELARLAELYVADGFPVSHRRDASVERLSGKLPGVKGFWQQGEEKLHDGFIDRLENSQARGKMTVLFGGAKADKGKEITAFSERRLHSGDRLVLLGLHADKLLSDESKERFRERGVEIVEPGEGDRFLDENGNPEDLTPPFTRRILDIIQQSQTVFWEGPVGRTHKDKAASFEIARGILSWAEADDSRAAFVSGGSTNPLFRKAVKWTACRGGR